MASESIDITPHWPGLRLFVRRVALTQPDLALEMASEMGSEAPTCVGCGDPIGVRCCEFGANVAS